MYMAPGRLLSPIASGGGPAGLDISFLGGTAATLDSRVTFSRAGMAWRYDSSGVLTTASHNLVTNSQDFENSAWSKTRTTVTGNVLAEPLTSTVTADKVVEATDVATTRSISQNISVVVGNTYTLSVYAKSAERSAINLRFGSGFAAGNVTFDLNAGTLTSGGTVASSSITSVGSGWYRCFCAFVCTSSTTAGAQVFLSSGGSITYDGVSGNGVYLFGAMVEQHTALRTYLTTSVKNMLGYSEQFDNAAWTKSSISATANAATDPFGTVYADKLIPAVGSVTGFISQTLTYAASTTYTFSCYGKAAEFQYLRMSFGLVGVRMATFDLVNGTVNAEPGLATPTMTAVGNGWYRCAISMASGAGGSANVAITVNGAATYAATALTGNGTSGLLVYGALLSSSGSLDTYSVNIAAAPTSAAFYGARFDHDPVTLAAKGLLIEEARTNLFAGDLTNVTNWPAIGSVTRAAGVTAPDNSTNGVTLTEPAGGTVSYGINSTSVTVTASTATTGSVFAKAGTCSILRVLVADTTIVGIAGQAYFNLSTGTVGTTGTFAGAATSVSATIQSVGNGWYRCTVTATLSTSVTGVLILRMTSADNTSTDTGSKTMSFFAPQIEVGAFVTSPILTTTAAATRAADNAIVAPLGSWFGSASGTFFVDATTLATTGIPVVGGVSDTLFDNVIYGTLTTTSNSWLVRTGNVQQAGLTGSGTVTGGVAKMAIAYAANDFSASCNGGACVTDTSGTVPTVTQMKIGQASWGAGGNYLNGYLRKIKGYDRRLPNAVLQMITTP